MGEGPVLRVISHLKVAKMSPPTRVIAVWAAMLWLGLAWIVPVRADDWTERDTARQAVVTGLLVADWGQTLDMTGRYDEGYWERNPLLGHYPSRGEVNTYFAAAIVGHYLIARSLSRDNRARWQWSFIVLEGLIVGHNYKAGLSLDF